jgi:hypothetical protein
VVDNASRLQRNEIARLGDSSEIVIKAVLCRDNCFWSSNLTPMEFGMQVVFYAVRHTKKQTYLGFMLEILSPLVDLTHSLLINRPVGCVYLTPLGAVSSTDRPDILRVIVKSLEGAGYLGNWKEKEAEERRRERYIENKKERGEEPS